MKIYRTTYSYSIFGHFSDMLYCLQGKQLANLVFANRHQIVIYNDDDRYDNDTTNTATDYFRAVQDSASSTTSAVSGISCASAPSAPDACRTLRISNQ